MASPNFCTLCMYRQQRDALVSITISGVSQFLRENCVLLFASSLVSVRKIVL